jgi:uncharacterized protein YjbJ (UPF0337 family)
MDDNQSTGTFQATAGKIEEAVGNFAGDAKTQVSGKARQAAGQAQQTYGQVVGVVRDFAGENPVGALLAAAGLGVMLGMILARR